MPVNLGDIDEKCILNSYIEIIPDIYEETERSVCVVYRQCNSC